ncbi:MAG: twin-arginine translocase subunit TatB [Gammaproteobacteria bacterium]|nr:twin-arginine translocase subunit TatB [Gammaproteobacteria bacterium]
MFDIGFWELLVIAVVLLLVMGPERLPEVAKQAAFLVRKARQGMYRLRAEMQHEIDATPFADLDKARQEMTDFKNDIKQFGRELADSAEQDVADHGADEQNAKKDRVDDDS